MLEDFP